MSEPRKATDILLSIEDKLEKLIGLLVHKDLSDKIISNKLNSLLGNDAKNTNPPVYTAEAVETPKNIKIEANDTLPMESTPGNNGFSRTSRPETFAGDNSYLKKPAKKEAVINMPIQIPKGDHVEIVVPQAAIDLNKKNIDKENSFTDSPINLNTVSVIQRVVDINGKSVFLAEIEIINSSLEVINKFRTNGAGKWTASLPCGQYNIEVKRKDPLANNKEMKASQSINIDGTINPLSLPVVVIK